MRTMPSMSPLLLALLAFGCSQDPGEGELLVVAYGESFIEDGIPAAEMDDGWAITFDRFDVVIADVSVGGSSLDAGDTLDLAQPSNGEGQQLGSLTVPAGDHSDASFQLDAVSLAGTATLGGVTKQFDWSFEPNVHYSDCEAVTTVPDGGQGALELTLHGDHFFFDSLVSGEPAVVFQALAERRHPACVETLIDMLPDSRNRRFLAQILIPLGSPLIGRTVSETGFSAEKGFKVIDLFRDGLSLRAGLRTVVIQAGDRIVLRTSISEVLTLKEAGSIAIGASATDRQPAFEPIQTSETLIMEGVIGPQSRLIGRSLNGLGLARLYGVYVLAIHRRGENVTNTEDIRFDVGDTVLLEGPARGMRQLFDDGILNNLTETTERAIRRGKAPIAVAALICVMGLAALDVLPISALALIAATAVVALGCLDHQEAYRAIRWDILMLIFGMLALGAAMEKSGAASLLVGQLAGLTAGLGPLAMLAVLYLVTSFLTEIMSNNAAAILLTPIAIGLGTQLGLDPRPFVVAVMFAASASFATPIGYQTNTLVYSAGGYRFSDFLKIGVPLNLVMFAASMIVIPMFWPLV